MAIGDEFHPSKRFRGERTEENVDREIDTDELDDGERNVTVLTTIDLETSRDTIRRHHVLPLGNVSPNITRNNRDERLITDELSRFHVRSDIPNLSGSSGLHSNSTKRGIRNWDLCEILEETNLDGDTLLNLFIIYEQGQCAYWLINLVPSPECLNLINNLFQSPLHLAVLTNQPGLVRRLIVGGAKVDCQDYNADTPLHIACKKGFVEIVQLLLQPVMHSETAQNDYDIPYQKIPQNLETLNSDGLTCLHVAALVGNLDVISILISKGSNINARDAKSGKTILHMAVESGDFLFLHFLLQKSDIDIEAKMYSGSSAIDLARGLNYIPMTWLLRDFGAQVSLPYEHYTSDYDSLPDSLNNESEDSDMEDMCKQFSTETGDCLSGVSKQCSDAEIIEMNTANICTQNDEDRNMSSDSLFEQRMPNGHDTMAEEMNVLRSDEQAEETRGMNTPVTSKISKRELNISQEIKPDKNCFECMESQNISQHSSDIKTNLDVRNNNLNAEPNFFLVDSALIESLQKISLRGKVGSCASNKLMKSDELNTSTRYDNSHGKKLHCDSDSQHCECVKRSVTTFDDSHFLNQGACNYGSERNIHQRQNSESENQPNANMENEASSSRPVEHCRQLKHTMYVKAELDYDISDSENFLCHSFERSL